MSKTNIPYATHVWNIVVGCTKFSPGCFRCYAERMALRLKRMGRPEYQDVVDDKGHWTGEVNLVESRLDEPLRWRKPRRVLVCSMGDLFHPHVPDEFLHRAFTTMIRVSRIHTFMLLTKYAKRMRRTVWWQLTNRILPPNIWPGVSVESPDQAWRIDELVKTPAAHRWLSIEPYLARIDLRPWMFDGMPHDHHPKYKRYEYPTGVLSWVVCGGESGPGYRPMDVRDAEYLYDQCKAAGVPFYGKQDSGPRPGKPLLIHGREIKELPWQ